MAGAVGHKRAIRLLLYFLYSQMCIRDRVYGLIERKKYMNRINNQISVYFSVYTREDDYNENQRS